jgi:hypothetical protein
MIMLPKFYQNCFQNLLTPAQYKMLEILIMLLQFHKTVTMEKLATVFPQPMKKAPLTFVTIACLM